MNRPSSKLFNNCLSWIPSSISVSVSLASARSLFEPFHNFHAALRPLLTVLANCHRHRGRPDAWPESSVFVWNSGKCTVKDTDLVPGETASTDKNPNVQAGDELDQMETLYIGKCTEWWVRILMSPYAREKELQGGTWMRRENWISCFESHTDPGYSAAFCIAMVFLVAMTVVCISFCTLCFNSSNWHHCVWVCSFQSVHCERRAGMQGKSLSLLSERNHYTGRSLLVRSINELRTCAWRDIYGGLSDAWRRFVRGRQRRVYWNPLWPGYSDESHRRGLPMPKGNLCRLIFDSSLSCRKWLRERFMCLWTCLRRHHFKTTRYSTNRHRGDLIKRNSISFAMFSDRSMGVSASSDMLQMRT